MPRSIANSVGFGRVFPQCRRPLLRNLIRTCHKAAVGANTREPAGLNEVDKAKLFGQFHSCNLSCIEKSSRNSGHSSCRTTGFKKTTLGVSARIEDAKCPWRRTVGVIETIVAGRSKKNGVVDALMMAV